LKEVNKNSTTIISNKFGLKSKTLKSEKGPSEKLPHSKKGYNGLGGQSKVLYIPKKASGFKKPTSTSTKSDASRKLKIPKNNMKISSFTRPKPAAS
jgi:hypothetical protein